MPHGNKQNEINKQTSPGDGSQRGRGSEHRVENRSVAENSFQKF